MNEDKLSKELESQKECIIALQMELSVMKQSSALKYRVEERNEWKALLSALQDDRRRLETENAALKAKTVPPPPSPSPRSGNSVSSDLLVEVARLKDDIAKERVEASLNMKNHEKIWMEQVDALKYRLDLELQSKFDNQQRVHANGDSSGGFTSYLFGRASQVTGTSKPSSGVRSPQRRQFRAGGVQRRGKLIVL